MLETIKKHFKDQEFTAYELLEVMPNKDQLLRQYGLPGRGSGNHFSAASYLAMKLKRAPGITLRYRDRGSETFKITSGTKTFEVIPGFRQYTVYKL